MQYNPKLLEKWASTKYLTKFEFSKKYKITKKDDCDLDCNIELRDSIKNSTIETKKIYKDFFDFCIDVVGIKDKKVEKVLGDMWQK